MSKTTGPTTISAAPELVRSVISASIKANLMKGKAYLDISELKAHYSD